MNRLGPRAGELIERERQVRFTFDGRPRSGLVGDTIGSALAAAGQRTFSRSFKYHRRRGLFCCSGQCPNCLVSVDGAPGVRACTEPLRDGVDVRHMNAWPSLHFDLMRAVDLVGRPFTPPGFYYKTFLRPRRLWPLWARLLRRAAGLGRLPAEPRERRLRADHRTRHADVLVIGGGEAGLHAAIAAAGSGADVVLADQGPSLGGRMVWERRHAEAQGLAAQLRQLGVEVLAPGCALGWFDGLVPIWCGDLLHRVRAAQCIVASGSIPQPLAFENNDLPGVMLCDAALRLAGPYAVQPGRRAVIAGVCDEGLDAALLLAEAGVEVAAVVDSRPAVAAEAAAALDARGIDLLSGAVVVKAHGRRAVRAVSTAALGTGGSPARRRQQRIDCDLIAVAGGRVPAASLLFEAGARAAYDASAGAFVAAQLPPGLHAAGAVTGAGASDECTAFGTAAGAAAAAALGGNGAAPKPTPAPRPAATGVGPRRFASADLPASPDRRGDRRCFLCLCEDVTEKDVGLAVAEGFDSIELAKRYLTLTMGPCQGRMCQLPSARSLAAATGTSVERVGTTTARPPTVATPLGVLAGRQHEPGSRSALDADHRELGAQMDWAGVWRRAFDYGDERTEALHVHRAAGLIDVSPLGKFLVQGRDAGEFLDRVYPNRLSTLEPMRLRYGALVTEAGRIMDDGTVCRLDEDCFYVTTTTSGSQAVLQWLRWWLAEWDMEVRLSDLTGVLGAMNLAGPRSREVLAPLTDLDLGAEGFPYLRARVGLIAGVRCLVLRLGFVGELGYEIHVPSVYARHLWGAILSAGREADVRPVGLEAQRVLRLEKQHLIVGQDTDTESIPFDAGMPWIVKLDKEHDFLGRWSLQLAADRAGPERLVGFTADPSELPVEGAAVVHDGAPAGRVTSCRCSRVLGRTVGLAWVPAELAEDGAEIGIASDDHVVRATVTTAPFFDPEGERQRA